MNKSLIIFGIVNITSDSFSDGGRYLAPDAAIAQARKLMAEGADVIDLGPASSNPTPRLFRPTQKSRVSRRCWTRSRQMAFPSRSTVINPRRKPMPCRVVWPISMIFAVFQTLRSYPQLAKSSAKLVVMHSVQDGQADRREAPAGDIMDHIAAFFDARIAALTGAGIKRNRLVLDPGMGFFWGCSRNLALGAGAVR